MLVWLLVRQRRSCVRRRRRRRRLTRPGTAKPRAGIGPAHRMVKLSVPHQDRGCRDRGRGGRGRVVDYRTSDRPRHHQPAGGGRRPPGPRACEVPTCWCSPIAPRQPAFTRASPKKVVGGTAPFRRRTPGGRRTCATGESRLELRLETPIRATWVYHYAVAAVYRTTGVSGSSCGSAGASFFFRRHHGAAGDTRLNCGVRARWSDAGSRRSMPGETVEPRACVGSAHAGRRRRPRRGCA